MKKLLIALFCVAEAGAAVAGIPLFNASCPGGFELHADEGGPVYANGHETRLKKFNDNYFEATDAKSQTVFSVSINPDGGPSVSMTGKHGANGVCTLKKPTGATESAVPAPTPAAKSAPVAPGNMVAYCRGEAAGQFNTKPAYITTGKLTRSKDGGYVVAGSGDLGDQGKKPFQCEYDRDGRFKHFKSLVNEGAL